MKKQENPLVNIIINIVLPVLILNKAGKYISIEPLSILLIALALPFIYGVYDFIKRGKLNMISLLGIVSVALTGLVGILELSPEWIAIKEAGIPFIFGIVVILSIFFGTPLINKWVYSEAIFQKELIESRFSEKAKKTFQRYLIKLTYVLSCTFFISSALNFILSRAIVISQPGTEQFNEEFAQLTALSFPVIALPSMLMMIAILYLIIRQIKKLTGLGMNEIFIQK